MSTVIGKSSGTCIVALVHNGKVHMGGDRRMSSGASFTKMKEPKIHESSGGFIFGSSGNAAFLQILKYLSPPIREENTDDDVYITRDLAFTIYRKVAEMYGEEKENIYYPEGEVIIGYRGEIYFIESYGGAIWLDSPYYAIGCGGAFALGSLRTSEKLNIKDPKKRIELAICAAADNSMPVDDNIDYLSI